MWFSLTFESDESKNQGLKGDIRLIFQYVMTYRDFPQTFCTSQDREIVWLQIQSTYKENTDNFLFMMEISQQRCFPQLDVLLMKT